MYDARHGVNGQPSGRFRGFLGGLTESWHPPLHPDCLSSPRQKSAITRPLTLQNL